VIDCSAYPATLLKRLSVEKGLSRSHPAEGGAFQQADGAPYFLDEIREIPARPDQAAQGPSNHKFERLGGEQTLSVSVRVIAATNRNLLDEVKRGQFREDLYYRLNVIPVHLPPLKERRNDIPVLARHFLQRFAVGQGKKLEGFSPEAMRLLLDYPWPGNVRELENTIEHAAVLVKGSRVEPMQFPSALHAFLLLPAIKARQTATR
jgi:two-component system response regulator HydG